MKFIWRGKYTGPHQLPLGVLPEGAVQYQEPDTPEQLAKAAVPYSLWMLVLWLALGALKCLLWREWAFSCSLLGILLSLALAIPHELIHGLFFPRKAEVECFQAIRQGMFFVISTCPISRRRFLWLSAAPTLLFGLLPLGVWMLLPPGRWEVLYTLGGMSLQLGCGDLLNIHHTFMQVPPGAMVQLSGFHSYWFLPERGGKSAGGNG